MTANLREYIEGTTGEPKGMCERTVWRMWSRTEEKEACGGGSGMWKSVEEEERLWWKWIDGMTEVEISRRIELGVCDGRGRERERELCVA